MATYAGDSASVSTVNLEELRAALDDAPRQTFTFTKQEMLRFGSRFRKKFIRERMSGPPGIKGGAFAQGKNNKNVRGFAKGTDLRDLRTVLKVSRLLAPHETGATITPKHGEFLYLSRKTGKAGHGHIFARVRSVTIPPRLHFRETANREIAGDLIPKIGTAMQRAMRVAMEQRMKSLTGLVGRVTAA